MDDQITTHSESHQNPSDHAASVAWNDWRKALKAAWDLRAERDCVYSFDEMEERVEELRKASSRIVREALDEDQRKYLHGLLTVERQAQGDGESLGDVAEFFGEVRSTMDEDNFGGDIGLSLHVLEELDRVRQEAAAR